MIICAHTRRFTNITPSFSCAVNATVHSSMSGSNALDCHESTAEVVRTMIQFPRSRHSKQLFCPELAQGKRHQGGEVKRYWDVLKAILNSCNNAAEKWRKLAIDRHTWKASVSMSEEFFETKCCAGL